MKEIKKLKKHVYYNEGLFNSNKDRVTVKCFNILFNKIDELVEEINILKSKDKTEQSEVNNT